MARRLAAVVGVVALGVLVAIAVALNPNRPIVVAAPVVAIVVGVGWLALRRPRTERSSKVQVPLTTAQLLAVVSLWCVVLSTLVFRVRTASDIAAEAVDSSGAYRLAMLGISGTVALASVVSQRRSDRPMPLFGKFYVAYVVAAALAVATATSPGLTLFRVGELAVFWLVWWAGYRSGATDAFLRGLRLIVIALLGAAVLGILLFPNEAILSLRGGLGFRFQGVLPRQSANTIGTLGVLAVAWALRNRRRVDWFALAIGVLVIVGNSYRTGYIALVVLVVVRLLLARGVARTVGLALLLVCVPVALANETVHELWLRGESEEQVSGLNGRVSWWELGLDAVERSPVVGVGLGSGTRFDVFGVESERTTSTVHGTWVETFVGTGYVGLLLLGGAVASGWVIAVRCARRTDQLLPVMLLAALTVRSISGTTVEQGSLFLLVFLVGCSVAAETLVRLGDRGGGGPPEPEPAPVVAVEARGA